jgi:hypothetical protein
MKKEAFNIFVFLLAAASGIAWTVLLTGQPTSSHQATLQPRSCQVKEVGTDGRVVWTPCDEWLRRK